MRLWSIHPVYLDAKGLVALWREGLLAQKVLQGETTGYKNHPQLIRFKATNNPVAAVSGYLRFVASEADNRGYAFDSNKIAKKRFSRQLVVTRDQIQYEFEHLLKKLKERSPDIYTEVRKIRKIKPHPLFKVVRGKVEDWEVI
jgi:hypothetical protein